MNIKNNYNECLTNLACSIRKYFDLPYNHNTIDYIDKILEEKKPKNVITILFDGMGSNILKRTLQENSFFVSNMLKPITTVFPATTVAATTAMLTGLNPVESGMLGWNIYYKGIDKIITTFINCEKEDEFFVPLAEAKKYKEDNMLTKPITEEINEQGQYTGYFVSPFGEINYESLDDMLSKIFDICQKDGKKYIYAYDTEPDHTMHDFGPDSEIVKKLIIERNEKVAKMCNSLSDTVIFIVADHGHIKVDNIFLKDYPEIIDCLKKNTSIEQRAVNFFIKDDKKEKFCTLFNKEFGEYFDLYSKEEIINSHLFGDGNENKTFREALGDYLAIAKSNKALVSKGDAVLYSQHAGYTDDEIYVPLIVVTK